MYGIQKNSSDGPLSRAGIEMPMQKTNLCAHEGRRGWNELREQHRNTGIAVCKIDDDGKLFYSSGSSASCSVTTQRGRIGGSGVDIRLTVEEIYVYLELIHIVAWQKPTEYSKAIIFQLKIKLKIIYVSSKGRKTNNYE